MTSARQKSQGLEPEADVSRAETFTRTFQTIASFTSVEIPSNASGLDFTGNLLIDFEGLQPTKHLQTLIVDSNPLLSFRGFPDQPLITFSAIDTPLSELPNFRHLALVAIGTQLRTLNGVTVTAQERADCATKVLATRVKEKVAEPNEEAPPPQDRLKQLRDCLRAGYLCNGWPRRLPAVLRAVEVQNEDPITVRILRVVRLAEKPESAADPILERIFAPAPPKAKAGNPQAPDDKLTKQEALIEFMSTQIKELTEARKQKFGTLKGKATLKKQGADVLSDPTRQAYDLLVEKWAQQLKANSAEIEAEQRKEPNHMGLRAAVIRVLGADPSASDMELAQRLRERTE
jgi:hypothetical protein